MAASRQPGARLVWEARCVGHAMEPAQRALAAAEAHLAALEALQARQELEASGQQRLL